MMAIVLKFPKFDNHSKHYNDIKYLGNVSLSDAMYELFIEISKIYLLSIFNRVK